MYKYIRYKMLSKFSVPLVCDCNNELVTDESESDNLLATVFNNVFVNELIDNLPHYGHIQVLDSLSVTKFPKEAVQEELAKISDKSSLGPDGFSSLLLKSCASTISEPLSFIMQCSF